jgi:hypothetical protein
VFSRERDLSFQDVVSKSDVSKQTYGVRLRALLTVLPLLFVFSQWEGGKKDDYKILVYEIKCDYGRIYADHMKMNFTRVG